MRRNRLLALPFGLTAPKWLISMSIAALAALNPEPAVAQTEKVVVRNTAAKPVPVRQMSNLPLETVQIGGGAAFNGDLCIHTWFVVPAGKRLVIEHVSAFVKVPEGQKVASEIRAGASQFIVMTEQLTKQKSFDPEPMTWFVSSQPLRMYGGENDSVQLVVERNTDAGEAHCSGAMTGYLVAK